MAHLTQLAAALTLAGLLGSPALAAGLVAPFPAVTPKAAAAACRDTVPDPVVSLAVTSIYDQTDDSRSTIDEDQFDTYNEDMSGLRDFLTYVTKAASDYVASGGKKAEKAACAYAFIDAWARGDALSDLDTRQSALSSTRIVAGMGMAYLAIRPYIEAEGLDTSAIEGWFAARATGFQRVYDQSGERNSNRANHRYWGGFAVAVSGVVTGDRALLDWGVASYRIGACQVDVHGALPLELMRAKKARDYHLHAVAPLIMIAELAEANGVDAYSLCDGALHRLVKFTLTSVADPSEIEALTGTKQLKLPTDEGVIRGDRLAWVEPYFKRFGGSETDYGIKVNRPMFSSNLGGRLTVMVAAKAG
ncbi:alginate lyase family protein [Devosia sp.]|jgi:poly(beta-D-mannuronate) lyase|uniref:alginate lyase family protein n=1 Tax=Devosia sp. TaxID=1871048 RepID=UPI0037C0AF5A